METENALILPGGIALREVVQADNVLDEEFIRGAVKMADVPRDLRSCFSCGRFVAKSRWQLDMSRMRLPVCADCDYHRDWLP